MNPDTRAELGRALAVALMTPLLALWPLPRVWGSALLGMPGQESADHLFGLWAALRAGQPLVVQSGQLNFPEGLRFVLVDPLNLAPFGLGSLFGPIAGFNTVLYAGLLVAGLAGALLARELGGRAWVGALLAGLTPALVSGVSEGQTENFALGFVGLQLVALLRYGREGRTLWGGLAALGLAACFYGGPYNGVFAALLDAAVGLSLLRRRPGVLAVGAAAMALVSPLAFAILRLRPEELPGGAARVGLPEATGLLHGFRGGLRYGVDLTDLAFPAPLTGGTHDIAHTGYLGLGVLVFACIAVWRQRALWPWLVGAAAFAVISLGPHLYWRGEVLRLGGEPALAPVGWLIALVDDIGRMNRWYRAAGVASLLLVPLAARAAPGWMAPLLAIDLLWLSPVPWPQGVLPPRFGELATLSQPGALLELPPNQDLLVRDSQGDENLYAATLHGRPLSGSFLGIPGWLGPAPEYRALHGVGERGAPFEPSFWREKGFAYLVWYPRYAHLSPAGRASLGQALGPPVIDEAEVVVWSLGP